MRTIQLSLAILVLALPLSTNAQLLGKLKRAVQDKVEQRIEDKIVEELSEELANRAMKPINKAFDEFLKASYENETGEKYDQAKFDSLMAESGEAYMDFLGSMNKVANVPAQYDFQYVLEIETQEESKEKHKTNMFFSKDTGVMGFHQTQDGQDMFMVMDPENDLMALFNNEDKTAQAMPSMFTLTKSLATVYVDEEDYHLWSFESTGKTKKIAGYNSKEYVGETELGKFSTYVSTELPFDWRDTYGGLLQAISPKLYNDESYDGINGMMMKSESYDKETKKKSRWEVKKVSTEGFTIQKSNYKFNGLTD